MKKLEELRRKRGISLRNMSKKVGISPTYLYDMEKGKRGITENVIAKLREMGISDDELQPVFLEVAKERDDLPYDIKRYLIGNPEAMEEIRRRIKSEGGGNS